MRVGAALALGLVLGAADAPPAQPTLDPAAVEAVATAARTYAAEQAKPPAEPEADRIKREKEDLKAQQNMALAAADQLAQSRTQTALAAGSTIAAIAGLMFSLLSLRQSTRAAEFAATTSRAQLRAYFTVKKFDVTGLEPGATPAFRIKFLNTGQTPGLDFQVRCKFETLGKDETPVEYRDDFGSDPKTPPMGPGEHETASFSLNHQLTLEDMAAMRAGDMRFGLHAHFRYRDIFGELHEETATFIGSQTGQSLSIIPA